MADGEGIGLWTPIAADSVNIAGTDPTAFDLDIHIVVTKWLRVEFLLLEIEPCLGARHLEPRKLVWIRHVAETSRRYHRAWK